MAFHNKLGQEAEDLAVHWLSENGYEILHRNWRYSHYEIDIVATKGKFLHFIEVKALHYSGSRPEESVKKKKFRNLQRAAHEYIFLNPSHEWIQYDILSITLLKTKEPEYFLIEDVFLR